MRRPVPGATKVIGTWQRRVGAARALGASSPSSSSAEMVADQRPGPWSQLVGACGRLADSPTFDAVMLMVIVVNASALGAQTFDGLGGSVGPVLESTNEVILGVFVVELLIRFTATGWRVPAFFASGWNCFDFAVVASSLVPGVNTSLLRILRLLRVVRAVRFLPDLQLLVIAVRRSVPGVLSLAAASLLLIYVYGMLGWVIFADHDPAHFGNIGDAMTTMFVLLTLENLPNYIETGQQLSEWTIVFFVSYVLVASFLVFNLFIGIVINSMEEARSIELRRAERERLERLGQDNEQALEGLMRQRLRALHDSVRDLEADLDALEQRRGA